MSCISGKNTPVSGKAKPAARKRARTRWLVAYTLTSNPALRAQRKSYLKELRDLQARAAKLYDLNKTAMGRMVREMNKNLLPLGSLSDQSVLNVSDAFDKWNQLIGMSTLLHRLERELNLHPALDNRAYSRENDIDTNTVTTGDNAVSVDDVIAPQMRWKMATFTALTNNKTASADGQVTNL